MGFYADIIVKLRTSKPLTCANLRASLISARSKQLATTIGFDEWCGFGNLEVEVHEEKNDDEHAIVSTTRPASTIDNQSHPIPTTVSAPASAVPASAAPASAAPASAVPASAAPASAAPATVAVQTNVVGREQDRKETRRLEYFQMQMERKRREELKNELRFQFSISTTMKSGNRFCLKKLITIITRMIPCWASVRGSVCGGEDSDCTMNFYKGVLNPAFALPRYSSDGKADLQTEVSENNEIEIERQEYDYDPLQHCFQMLPSSPNTACPDSLLQSPR